MAQTVIEKGAMPVATEQTDTTIKELNALGASTKDIKESVIATLYFQGKITGKQACEVLNIPRRDWEESILAKYGYTTMRDIDDSEAELESSNW